MLVLVQAVVVEFCPSTASPLGLPWEQHDRCRKSLQQDYLHTFYQHAASVAGDVAHSASQGDDGGLCCACLSLMAAVLTWDFRSALLLYWTCLRLVAVVIADVYGNLLFSVLCTEFEESGGGRQREGGGGWAVGEGD